MKKKVLKKGSKDGRPKTTVKQRVKKLGLDYDKIGRMLRFGLTDEDLAFVLCVSKMTINNWKKKDKDFYLLLKRQKEIADAKVVFSLYERATGYSHPDVHISNFQGMITKTGVTKHYPPDATSMIFWLKNRQPDKWRDKTEVEVKTSLLDKYNKMSPEERAAEWKLLDKESKK